MPRSFSQAGRQRVSGRERKNRDHTQNTTVWNNRYKPASWTTESALNGTSGPARATGTFRRCGIIGEVFQSPVLSSTSCKLPMVR